LTKDHGRCSNKSDYLGAGVSSASLSVVIASAAKQSMSRLAALWIASLRSQ
jgi:hypothetical protein